MLEWYTDCLLKSLLIQVLHDVEPCSLSPHSRTKLNQLCICSADDCTAGQNAGRCRASRRFHGRLQGPTANGDIKGSHA